MRSAEYNPDRRRVLVGLGAGVLYAATASLKKPLDVVASLSVVNSPDSFFLPNPQKISGQERVEKFAEPSSEQLLDVPMQYFPLQGIINGSRQIRGDDYLVCTPTQSYQEIYARVFPIIGSWDHFKVRFVDFPAYPDKIKKEAEDRNRKIITVLVPFSGPIEKITQLSVDRPPTPDEVVSLIARSNRFQLENGGDNYFTVLSSKQAVLS